MTSGGRHRKDVRTIQCKRVELINYHKLLRAPDFMSFSTYLNINIAVFLSRTHPWLLDITRQQLTNYGTAVLVDVALVETCKQL